MSTTLLSSAAGPFAPIDAETFRAGFNRRPFKIEHHLVDHPLFALPRLIELARRLPESRVEYNAGDIPVSQDPDSTPRNGLSIEDTIRRIEECRSWMVLKNVELDDEYKALLDTCLREIARYSEPLFPGMCLSEGFVFITSPESVTPFHLDHENNFLLQIRGRKQVQLFDRDDRAVISEEELEAFYSGAHRNLVYKDDFRTRGEFFDLEPGEALHFPVAAPHWVQNGPEVSISFSVTFQTGESRRRAALHRLNRQLRRWGLSPRPVGRSRSGDAIKSGVIQAIRLYRRCRGLKVDGPRLPY